MMTRILLDPAPEAAGHGAVSHVDRKRAYYDRDPDLILSDTLRANRLSWLPVEHYGSDDPIPIGPYPVFLPVITERSC